MLRIGKERGSTPRKKGGRKEKVKGCDWGPNTYKSHKSVSSKDGRSNLNEKGGKRGGKQVD